VRLQFAHSTTHTGLGRVGDMKVCPLASDLMWRQHVPLSNSWPSRFPSCDQPHLPVRTTVFHRMNSTIHSVIYNTRDRVVNRVKLRSDTCARHCHPLKQKRFARRTGNPMEEKQKQEPQKVHFTPFPAVSVANCLSIT
jgi:hypothetical protein